MDNKIFVGKMNSGKTNKINELVDTAINNNESFFFLDSKYEYISKYYDLLKKNGYNISVIDLRDPLNSDSFNPLTLPYKLYKENKNDTYLEILEQLIGYIVKEENNSNDPFWSNSASNLIIGVILTLFKNGVEEEINFNSVMEVIQSGYLNDYFANYQDTPGYSYAKGTVLAPMETKGGIISTAIQKLRLYVSRENLSRMLSKTTLDYDLIKSEKSAIFFINYDSVTSYNSLVNAFIGGLYLYLEDNKLSNKFNFILDNFDSLGYFSNFKQIMSSSNVHDIRFIIGTRDIDNINNNYGKLDNISELIEVNGNVTNTLGKKIDYINTLVDEVKVIDISKYCQ